MNRDATVVVALNSSWLPSTNTFNSPSHANNILLYPNPCEDWLNIVPTDKVILSVEVYNLVGKRIFTKTTYNKNSLLLDSSSLVNGFYYARILFENKERIELKFQVLK